MNQREKIRNQISDYDLFCHYLLPYVDLRQMNNGDKFLSPLRKEDVPSFNVYEHGGNYYYKDFGSNDRGDVIDFVMKLFSLDYKSAINKICEDFKIDFDKFSNENSNFDLNSFQKIIGLNYILYIRPFNESELAYWGTYGITKDILMRYGTVSVEAKGGISKLGKPYTLRSTTDSPIFAYPYGNTCMKIYQPKAERKYRFQFVDRNEKDKDFVFGLNQITKQSDKVIIAAGEKDTMSLNAQGFNAITGTSETGKISKQVLNDLKANGYELIILFDTDNTGIESAKKMSKEHGIKMAMLPNIPNGGKDVSDFFKEKMPLDELKQIIDNAEIVPPDTPSFNNKLINSDISSNLKSANIIWHSEREFAYDIWMFSYTKNGPLLKGIYRYGIVKVLEGLGFYKRCRDNNTYFFIKEEDNIIEEVEVFMMTNAMQSYIDSIGASLQFYIKQSYVDIPKEKLHEMFLRQSHTIFNRIFLAQLVNHNKEIIRDKKDSAYFFFMNKVVEATIGGLKYLEYSDLKNVSIWRSYINEHKFEYVKDNKDCHFSRFIDNVTNNEPDRGNTFISVIGYLLHNFIHATSSQAVIANDEDISDPKNPMGGTGKGLFANALRRMRVLVKIDGKKFDEEDKFKFQDISESTQIAWFDDIKHNFDFSILHSCLTDGWSIEKKYQDQFFIKREDSPKVFICSNSIITNGGTTNLRRQIIIEFSNHYSKKIRTGVEEPIKAEHGCTFFDNEDWDVSEWNKFYSYMLDCVHYYFNNGLQTYEYRSLEANRLRQTTSLEFYEWIQTKKFEVGVDYITGDYFKDFRDLYYGDDKLPQAVFTNWIKKFAASKKWEIKIKRSNSVPKFVFYEQAVGRSPTLF